MRTTLVSVLVILAQWRMPAYAQQAGALPTSVPAASNGYLPHPLAKRLFFFASDPKNMERPAARPAVQTPGPGGFLRPDYIAPQSPQPSSYPTLKFAATGLLPLESSPPQDLWRFLRPKNTRLFFFSKP
jgi:hypothetical protein